MANPTYDKQRAEELVGMIDTHDVKAYNTMKTKTHCQTTPIPAKVWTEHLKSHFVQGAVPERNEKPLLLSRLPSSLQLQSRQLRSRIITPSDIAVPPGPGGRYRQNSSVQGGTNQTQASASAAYELPSAVELSNYVHVNISRMTDSSSFGFDPYTTPFIKHVVENYGDETGRKQTKHVLLPLLIYSSCS